MTDDEFLAASDSEQTIIKPKPHAHRSTNAKTGTQQPPGGGAQEFDRTSAPDGIADGTSMPDGRPGAFFAGIASNAFEDQCATPSFASLFGKGGTLNPLVAACAPLLHAAVQLRASEHCADPVAVRDALAHGVRRFETQARNNGISFEAVLAARYIVCAVLDEAACCTPWGASAWPQQSLLVMFHNEAFGGSKVFELLACFAEKPAECVDLLELVALALALGFEGQYRVNNNGRHTLEALRRRLSELIRQQRGVPLRELSPHWTGISAPRPRATDVLPLWLVGVFTALMLTGVYIAFNFSINRVSDRAFAQIASIRAPSVHVDTITPAPRPRLASLLAAEIKAGRISVSDQQDRSVITLGGDSTFTPGSAQTGTEARVLLERVATALKAIPGKVVVTGHTDNQPVHSSLYASNWQLSRERAERVRALLITTMDPDRVVAEGHADTEPVSPNETLAGRARNRRVEVTLFVRPR